MVSIESWTVMNARDADTENLVTMIALDMAQPAKAPQYRGFIVILPVRRLISTNGPSGTEEQDC